MLNNIKGKWIKFNMVQLLYSTSLLTKKNYTFSIQIIQKLIN